jgi:hypothetical protein
MTGQVFDESTLRISQSDADGMAEFAGKGLTNVAGVQLEPVLNYTTFFAEWCQKGSTILVHLFPRAGVEDQWTFAHYINKCRNCRAELKNVKSPCPRGCKRNVGPLFTPARREIAVEGLVFPFNMSLFIRDAANVVWKKGVATDDVPELAAIIVQFQEVGEETPELGTFFDYLDARLDASSSA